MSSTKTTIAGYERATVGAGYARALLEFAVAKGADKAQLIQRSGVDPAALEDQDNRVGFAAYVRLMRAGQALSGDPALALHLGEATPIWDISIVGLIGSASETLADAFVQLNRYSRLVIDLDGLPGGGDRLVLSREGDDVWIVDTRPNPNAVPEITESSFARMVSAGRRLGSPQHVKAVCFTHPAPAYADQYAAVFQVPVAFDSPRNAVRTDAAWMSMRSTNPQGYVFGVLSDRADALLRALETADSVRGRVEAELLPRLHTGAVGMDWVAGRMGLSRPTLARRLKAEGTTFETVLDDLRHRLALDYLGGRKVSVNETAYLTGFSDPAAFSRAFKRWTGVSPSTLRAGKA